jgi:ABC-type uncharacterized transport system involved in gliding motility auxiliary subunit
VKRFVGVLGWLGVVLVLAAVVVRFSQPGMPQVYRGLAYGGLIVIGLYLLTQWRDIARSFQGRQVRYGSITAGSVVLFLAILVFINIIGQTRNMRWDVTEAQQFTLADQTRQILSSLDQPLTIRAFHGAGEGGSVTEQELRDRLDEYSYHSSQVQVVYVNAIADPLPATQIGVTALPTLVLEYADRTERINATDEASVTNGLKKVIEGQAKTVYFIQGHGEHDPLASDGRGYSGIAERLANDNFAVEKLTLAQTGAIPDDATVIVIAGPRNDYFEPEIAAIDAFLARGGKLLMMVNPPETPTAPPLTNLVALAHTWAIEVGENIVIDESGIGQVIGGGPETPVAMPVAHPITTPMGRVFTAHPLARSVRPVEGGVDGRFAQSILESNQLSWAESDVAALFETGRPERNLDAGDLNGPVALAAAVSAAAPDAPEPPAPAEGEDAAAEPPAPAPETRVVVVGDSDFASNNAVNMSGNGDLFLNAANWLAQQEDLIAIRPRDPADRRISLTSEQMSMVNILALFVFPGLLFLAAVGVWWRRR